jgi:hypothetical protein
VGICRVSISSMAGKGGMTVPLMGDPRRRSRLARKFSIGGAAWERLVRLGEVVGVANAWENVRCRRCGEREWELERERDDMVLAPCTIESLV